MDANRIKELRELCARTTPGPWDSNEPYSPMVTAKNPYGHDVMHIADIRGWGHLTGKGACALTEEKACEIQAANSAFIAAARTALPELLDALEASMKRETENESLIKSCMELIGILSVQNKEYQDANLKWAESMYLREAETAKYDLLLDSLVDEHTQIVRLTAERDAAVKDLSEHAPFAATCKKWEENKCGWDCQSQRCPGWEWRGPCVENAPSGAESEG